MIQTTVCGDRTRGYLADERLIRRIALKVCCFPGFRPDGLGFWLQVNQRHIAAYRQQVIGNIQPHTATSTINNRSVVLEIHPGLRWLGLG